ncbi:MAG: hypothetical protein D6778_06940 [Nitrospirae bacterium]|nr:MAG: hypothetical protein D6778_06940 [Nitrospirota bacterium]
MKPKEIYSQATRNTEDWFTNSGVIELFREAPQMTRRFNDAFGFNLKYYGTPPEKLDGDEEAASTVALYVVRENRLLPERRYCLYLRVQPEKISAHIGYVSDGNIITITELGSFSQVKSPQDKLYDWLRALMRASCEKLA